MSRPLITVPAVETVMEPDAFRAVPAGTPVFEALGQEDGIIVALAVMFDVKVMR
jgi:hypothetical protein